MLSRWRPAEQLINSGDAEAIDRAAIKQTCPPLAAF
jgi:hypothetical protein